MIEKRILNRIARHLDEHNPFNQEGFEDELKRNLEPYGGDLEALDPARDSHVIEQHVRAQAWSAAIGGGDPYAGLVTDHFATCAPLTGMEAIFAAGLQGARKGDAPNCEKTALLAAQAAALHEEVFRHEYGMAGLSDCISKGILEAIEEVARAKGDGNRIVALAKLWGLCVYATGEVGENWSLFGDEE